MLIGILDLLYDRVSGGIYDPYRPYFRKQFMGIMPQAIAVWCRQLGHQVHYRTYWGQADPLSLLPSDVDVLFISSYTQSSALAYAIGTIFKKRKALTVIGGPHARSFPTDCTRFFDIVVQNCDRQLIGDILRTRFDPPQVVSSSHPVIDIPSVEERMPEIRVSAFRRNRPTAASTVPMLSSVGCPYDCSFCIDWNSKYVTLSTEQLHADLEFLSRNYSSLLVGFHDPNFGIRFDHTLDVIERLPTGHRNRYVMECSLSVLKAARLPRLRDTNCVYVAPGVESWTEYSNKAGTGINTGRNKLEKVIAQLALMANYVPGIQVNFMFGADSDAGKEPVDLTKEFMQRTPGIWPTINIPTPFGGTPFYDQLYREGRILKMTPFQFYYTPYLSIITRNYDPVAFYDYMIDLNLARASATMFFRRLANTTPPVIRLVNILRTVSTRLEIVELRRIKKMLASDSQFRAYHEGRSAHLPAFYMLLFDRSLGRYAEVLPPVARQPVFDPPAPITQKTFRSMRSM